MVIANWKMELTIAEGEAFALGLSKELGALAERIEVVLFPAYPAIHAVAQQSRGSGILLGAQDVSAAASGSYTGQVSARQLADAGCTWVMLGHWEVRRHRGDTDEVINEKAKRCLEAGLRPFLLVGQGRDEPGEQTAFLEQRMARLLAGCDAADAARMAFMYEPEATVGAAAPVSPAEAAAGCGILRGYLRSRYGDDLAENVRVLYGGSVAPEFAPQLLSSPEVDGLGVGRKGREVAPFAEIVRSIAAAKGLA
jgi:triosephosphate isomerase